MTNQAQPVRLGNKSFENVVRTDERYGHDGFWLGPRGRDYGALLEHPKPYQVANLYPDSNASYWIAQFELPVGATLKLRGRFPICRYMSFAVYRPDPLGSFTATGEALVDHQIAPDEGSVNPFVPGASRLGEQRDYTVYILGKEAPTRSEDREPNTLYAGTQGLLQIAYRVYLPDVGMDGSGGVGLPAYDAELADGTTLSPAEVKAQLNRPMSEGIKSGMSVEQWRALCNAPDNDPELKPESTPARNPPVVERFFNNEYNFVGVFKTKEAHAKLSQKVETGFGGDPVTLYLFAWVSRALGPVLVLRGKMPKFADTFMGNGGKGLQTMTDWESRYWSLIICEAPPSGLSNDGLTDMQVPLDGEGNYTIVVSRKNDRPVNATADNGIAWMEWSPRGEGIDDPSNRTDFGMLVFRFMYNNPKWKHNPTYITVPGTEAEVMGPYYPRGEYMDKAMFERKGLKQ